MNQTHSVSVCGGVVIKRYVDWARGEHLREWAALQLVSAAEPDLVPAPLRCSWGGTSGSSLGGIGTGADGADGPSILMSLVPGRPLAGALAPEELAGLGTALLELWSIPADDLTPISYSAFVDRVRETTGTWRSTGIVGAAQTAATAWLSSGVLDQYYEPSVPVLGHGDPNLSNYLWDGSRVRIIDFEDAGRSDLAMELANLVEHLACRTTDWTPLIDRFTTTGIRTDANRSRALQQLHAGRFHAARCLWAAFWLTMLRPGGPAVDRNPPNAGNLQAARFLSLLSTYS